MGNFNFSGAGSRKIKSFWISMKQEMMEWQQHQLDHTQITCQSTEGNN